FFEDGPPVMPEDPYAYVVAAFQALPAPDYVHGPEEPEQTPPSPVFMPYVPEPVYPEYIPVKDEGRQTKIFQRVEALVEDSQYHYETGRLIEQEAIVPREAWAHSIGLSSAGHLVTALGEIQALQAREQARAGTPQGAGSST
nr:hypothetical protein [Tanacetum cinerariifolium]